MPPGSVRQGIALLRHPAGRHIAQELEGQVYALRRDPLEGANAVTL